MTRKIARIIILLIWASAAAIMSPWAVFYQQDDISNQYQTLYVCYQAWPSPAQEKGYFLGVIFLTCYTLPLILISVCYTFIGLRVCNRQAPGVANTSEVIYRSKVKVLKMLVVVVILFALSWLPMYAIQVRFYFGAPLNHTDREFYIISDFLKPVSQWLGSSNSCVNPILYCFFSKKFRRGFKDFIHCCKRTHTNPYFNHNSSTVYRSVKDGNGLTMYTSIRSQAAIDRNKQALDETTCF